MARTYDQTEYESSDQQELLDLLVRGADLRRSLKKLDIAPETFGTWVRNDPEFKSQFQNLLRAMERRADEALAARLARARQMVRRMLDREIAAADPVRDREWLAHLRHLRDTPDATPEERLEGLSGPWRYR